MDISSSVVIRPRTEPGPLALNHLCWEVVIDREHFGFYPTHARAEQAALCATGLKPRATKASNDVTAIRLIG